MTRQRLHSGFVQTAAVMPGRSALNVNGKTLTYGELFASAARIAATIQLRRGVDDNQLTAVFAERSSSGFAGILGALLAGDGYVPLNNNFPVARTRWMLRQAGCRSLIVDSVAATQLDALLESVEWPLTVILPEQDDVSSWCRRYPRHTFVGAGDLVAATAWTEDPKESSEIAYLLFTSGSTGDPKGVAVAHDNVTHFINHAVEHYEVAAEDRFSQTFDLTFDLSVFDLFVAWQRGACVYCPPRAALLNPDRFIRDNELTVWFSVPTVGLLMKRFGALQPRRYPSLRWSLFCGEPLPMDLAEAWTAAAPNARLENLYGPTELTVACTAYRWDASRSPSECRAGIVPIGESNPAMRAKVVDDALQEVLPGDVGELLMSGPQRTSGYWRDPGATARSWVSLPGESDLFYRTGDRVRKPAAVGDPLIYVGRRDLQIKVLGHRVELGEVESALRDEPGVEQAIAVGWPLSSAGASGVAAFVTGQGIDAEAIRTRLKAKLQGPAVPQTIRVLSSLPHNANGKVDRNALVGLLTS